MSISMHWTPRLSANTRAWGLMRVATNSPFVGASVASQIEPLLVAEQLLDPGDLPDPLHLDHHGAALTVPAQQVDGPDVGRVLAPDDAEVVTKGAHARGDELLQLGLDAVLRQAGIVAQRDVVVEQHLVQRDGEALSAGIGGDDRARLFADRAGRIHPVQRLVRLAVGMHRDRAIGLEQDQPLRRREPGAEPAFVLDRASRHDQPHVPRCTTATTSRT